MGINSIYCLNKLSTHFIIFKLTVPPSLKFPLANRKQKLARSHLISFRFSLTFFVHPQKYFLACLASCYKKNLDDFFFPSQSVIEILLETLPKRVDKRQKFLFQS